MNGRKIISRFRFTLHTIKAPRDHGNVNEEKINIKCTMDNFSWCKEHTTMLTYEPGSMPLR
jgi:predicted nucleic acid binding AN1-type Zn finger protein